MLAGDGIALEREIKETIKDLEANKCQVKQRIARQYQTLEEVDRTLRSWYHALADHRRRFNLPDEPDELDGIDYAALGPTAMVFEWAENHNGDVVIKDLTRRVLDAGLYRDYRSAYNTVRAPLERLENFSYVAPGHYRMSANGSNGKGTTVEMPPVQMTFLDEALEGATVTTVYLGE